LPSVWVGKFAHFKRYDSNRCVRRSSSNSNVGNGHFREWLANSRYSFGDRHGSRNKRASTDGVTAIHDDGRAGYKIGSSGRQKNRGTCAFVSTAPTTGWSPGVSAPARSKLGHFDWPEWKAYRDEGRP
jgi:hypothetical protein